MDLVVSTVNTANSLVQKLIRAEPIYLSFFSVSGLMMIYDFIFIQLNYQWNLVIDVTICLDRNASTI